MPVTISHAKSNTIADFTGTVTVYNQTGGTASALATNLVRPSDWNSNHQVTLSLTGSEVASLFSFSNGLTSSTNGSGVTVGQGAMQFYEPFPLPNTNSTLSAPGIGTWYLDGPYIINEPFNSGQIILPVSNAAGFLNTIYSAASSGSASKYMTIYNNVALYRPGTGASTSRLESYWTGQITLQATQEIRNSGSTTSNGTISHYLTLSLPSQYDASGGMTYGSTSQSGTVSYNASTGASTIGTSLISGAANYVTGARADIIPVATLIQPGVYWFAHMFTSSTSVTGSTYTQFTVFSTQSRLGLLENNMLAYKRLGASTSNASTGFPLFHGFLATTTSAATSIINTSDVRGTTGRAYFNLMQTTY